MARLLLLIDLKNNSSWVIYKLPGGIKLEDTMKNKEKLKLEEIKVLSFVTTLDNNEQKNALAGMNRGLDLTSLRLFC